jgi:CRISPR-associated Csh1 family protein
MIKNLYTIGRVLQEKHPEYFKPWENPFPGKKDAKVICVKVVDKKFKGIEEEEFKNKLVDKYLFRPVEGKNGTNLVPTLRLNISRKEKDRKEDIRKIIKKVKQSINNYNHNFIEDQEIEKLKSALENHSFNPDYGYILTFKINGSYFGDFEEYKDLFDQLAYKKYYKDSSSKNKLCSLKYETQENIWGRVDTLGFSVNNKSFNRNGFEPKNSYKMFPVSEEAVKVLEGTKRFIFNNTDKQLSNHFVSGIYYIVLPHFIQYKDNNTIYDLVEDFFNKEFISTNRKNSIISTEKIFQEIINEDKLSKADIYYDIFFYKQEQAQFRIILQLNDVLPSQLKYILQEKQNLEDFYRRITYVEGRNNKNLHEFFLTFSTIRHYFADKNHIHSFFYKIIESVFYGIPINERELLKFLLKQIQSDYKNDNFVDSSVKESFAIYYFLLRLRLFKNKLPMEKNKDKEVALTHDAFIEQHPEFFNSDYKKGVFLLGCLTEILLQKQRSRLHSEPFHKMLNGLNIDERVIEKILPKLIDKLRQYEIYYTTDLEKKVANYLVNPVNINKYEMSYAFTLGLIMQKQFTEESFQETNSENK